MPFKEWLDKYKPEGDTFDFEAFKADALKEFGTDEGVWTAKVNDVEEAAKNTAEELRKTKVHNYDLLQRIPSDDKNPAGTPKEDEQPPELTIDDFFKIPEKAS